MKGDKDYVWVPIEQRPWPENMPWYDRADPYPRRRYGDYTSNPDGTLTMTRQDFLNALLSRDESDAYEEKLAAWWQRMRARGARTAEDFLPEWRTR